MHTVRNKQRQSFAAAKEAKTVFILGAGASRAAGGPLMFDFIEQASRVLRKGDAGWATEYIEASLNARKKLQSAYIKANVDLDNIENLFATYEMASLIGRLNGLSSEEVEELPRSLRYLIMRTLEQSILFPLNGLDNIVPGPFPYEQFLDLLQCLQSEKDTGPIAVINFNYDLCLDYSIYLRGITPFYALPEEHPKKDQIAHYKVHGSLNWFRDPVNDTIIARDVKPLDMKNYWDRLGLNRPAERPIDTMELLDGSHMWGAALLPEPIIVPPTWNKGWYQQQLKSVWRAASQAIATAENIFVIGYSLPPSDQFFRAFWSLSSISDSVIERFWLFDPSPNQEIVKRFSSMLGPAIIERDRFKSEQLKFSDAIRYIGKYFGLRVEEFDDR
jgi:hypothetical protein